MWAVLKREYLSIVRKKMFIFMTIFFPVLMAGVFFIPVLVMARTLTGKSVAVIDGTGRLRDAFQKGPAPGARGRRRNADLSQVLGIH